MAEDENRKTWLSSRVQRDDFPLFFLSQRRNDAKKYLFLPEIAEDVETFDLMFE